MKTFTQDEVDVVADMISFCEERYDEFLKSCFEDVSEFDETLLTT